MGQLQSNCSQILDNEQDYTSERSNIKLDDGIGNSKLHSNGFNGMSFLNGAILHRKY